MNTKAAVLKLLDVTRTRLQTMGVSTPSDELVLLTAKELNLVVGKRGRFGGTFATDNGVQSLGYDLAEFRTAEAQETELVRAEKAKKKTEGTTTNEQQE